MRSKLAALALAALGAGASPPRAADEWIPARPGYEWSFPRDHYAHAGYRNEWWYFTGIVELDGAPGRQFSYQLTFFRIGLMPRRPPLDSFWTAQDLCMAHAAVTDLGSGKHRFTETFYRAIPLLAGFGKPGEPVVAWSRGPPGTEGRWEVRTEGDAFRIRMEDRKEGLSFELDLSPERQPILEGPGGVSRKAEQEGFASLYYSLTRLRTHGTVGFDGRARRVHGESWMDREFGSSQLAPDQVGWDWFGLRLRDGRDLMLYVLRGKDGELRYQSGTLVDRGGLATWLTGSEFRVRPTARWRSPATGAYYPAGWQVEVLPAHLSLRVEPVVRDQENRGGRGPFYWEGAVRVFGAGSEPLGEGFVELTGYGAGNRPPI